MSAVKFLKFTKDLLNFLHFSFGLESCFYKEMIN